MFTTTTDTLEEKFKLILPYLNESLTRKYLASEAIALGQGGIKTVSSISGIHRNTISSGIKELRSGDTPSSSDQNETSKKVRIRAKGGGRKSLLEKQPGLLEALNRIVDPDSYGDPMRPLRWTIKSLRTLAAELQKEGFIIHKDKVGDCLKRLGFSLQQNQKMKQVGPEAEYRDEQFRHINDTVAAYISQNIPVISIDCKKKENIGNFKNGGADYRPAGNPVEVLDHDFPLKEGKAAPYGVYDINRNEGYVTVGISSDTAMFAANSIRNWWNYMGKERYPNASKLFITADGGGSNGYRCRLWKYELQKLANDLGFPIEVSHFPPGTSKWNKIEHRLFSQITRNWRGRPLDSIEVMVSLIAATTTEAGLSVQCGVDETEYQTGIKVSDEDYADINLIRNEFCGHLNYTIFQQ